MPAVPLSKLWQPGLSQDIVKCPLGDRITHEGTEKWDKLKEKNNFYSSHLLIQNSKRKGPGYRQPCKLKSGHFTIWKHPAIHRDIFCMTFGLFWRQQADNRWSEFLLYLSQDPETGKVSVDFIYCPLCILLTLERREVKFDVFFFPFAGNLNQPLETQGLNKNGVCLGFWHFHD